MLWTPPQPQNDIFTIDISGWPNGVYLVKSIINNGPAITYKFIKL
ncbi:MAG: T9SS type A sorting domain-containing protein [Saprospiraceae bacterium]|nr:T9SS type A sorting domain-containing protein [Saprospiraceae bacterium]